VWLVSLPCFVSAAGGQGQVRSAARGRIQDGARVCPACPRSFRNDSALGVVLFAEKTMASQSFPLCCTPWRLGAWRVSFRGVLS
jgi:hypothetical protein